MKSLLTTLALFVSIIILADDHTDYAATVAELGENVNVKYMDKTWKKGGADEWIKETKNAADFNALQTSVLKFEDFLIDKTITTAWSSERTDWETRCKDASNHSELTVLLIELEAGIFDEAFNEGWVNRVDTWGAELEGLATKILQSSEQITISKEEFLTPFQKIFDDSYNSFSAIIDGEESYQLLSEGAQYTYYSANTKLPNAYSVYITLDEDGLYEYVCYINAGHFKENALSIMEQIHGYMDGQKKEGFVMHENVSVQYEDRLNYTLEFQGEKFIDTGKQATSTVGVMKKDDLYMVVVRITEPVFKR